MTNVDINEALTLTIAGVGAVFFILFLILGLTLLLKRVLPSGGPGVAATEAGEEEASQPDRNDKELAAVAAVAATLALDEGSGAPARPDTVSGSSWKRFGREQAMSSRGRRGWRR